MYARISIAKFANLNIVHRNNQSKRAELDHRHDSSNTGSYRRAAWLIASKMSSSSYPLICWNQFWTYCSPLRTGHYQTWGGGRRDTDIAPRRGPWLDLISLELCFLTLPHWHISRVYVPIYISQPSSHLFGCVRIYNLNIKSWKGFSCRCQIYEWFNPVLRKSVLKIRPQGDWGWGGGRSYILISGHICRPIHHSYESYCVVGIWIEQSQINFSWENIA